MLPIEKKTLIKVIGSLATLYAFAPIIYSKFDNVANTGNKTADDFAETVHDGAMTFFTIFTAMRALVLYLIARAVIYLLPSSVFKSPVTVVSPKML